MKRDDGERLFERKKPSGVNEKKGEEPFGIRIVWVYSQINY